MTECAKTLTGSIDSAVNAGKHRVRFTDSASGDILKRHGENGHERLTSMQPTERKRHEPEPSLDILPCQKSRTEKDRHEQYSPNNFDKEPTMYEPSMTRQAVKTLKNPHTKNTAVTNTELNQSVVIDVPRTSSELHVRQGVSKHRRTNSDYIEVSGKSSDEESSASDNEEVSFVSCGDSTEGPEHILLKTETITITNDNDNNNGNRSEIMCPTYSNEIVNDGLSRFQPNSTTTFSDSGYDTSNAESETKTFSVTVANEQSQSRMGSVFLENLDTKSFTPLPSEGSSHFMEDTVDSRSSIGKFHIDDSNCNYGGLPHSPLSLGQGHSLLNVSMEINNLNQLSTETEVKKINNCLNEGSTGKAETVIRCTEKCDKSKPVQGKNTESKSSRFDRECETSKVTKQSALISPIRTDSEKRASESKAEKFDASKSDTTVTASMKEAIRDSFTVLLDMLDVLDLCDNLYERSLIDLKFYEMIFEMVMDGRKGQYRNASRKLLIYLSHRYVNKSKMIDALYGSAQFQLIPFFFPDERL